MSYFFDVDAFLKHMEGVVDIVTELPPHLQGTCCLFESLGNVESVHALPITTRCDISTCVANHKALRHQRTYCRVCAHFSWHAGIRCMLPQVLHALLHKLYAEHVDHG